MTDFPPDLPRLRTLQTWLRYSLARVQQEIAAKERREQERQRGIAARPPVPDWVLERGLNRASPPVSVHTGDCRMSGKRVEAIDQAAARRALAEGVTACTHCRPDRKLGFIDG
ncbi:DUF6233 domain-containing protein [Streptomyces seoulensis]